MSGDVIDQVIQESEEFDCMYYSSSDMLVVNMWKLQSHTIICALFRRLT